MDYFQIKSDKRYFHPPIITNLSDIVTRRKDMSLENASKLTDINVGFASCEYQVDYLDILDEQLFLINDDVKKVFSMYDPSILFKTICIINNLDGSYCNYNAPLFPKVDCLPDEYKRGQIRKKEQKLTILKDRVKENSIFKIDEIEEEIILIRLDVAESLLRRGIKRFTLERVALEGI